MFLKSRLGIVSVGREKLAGSSQCVDGNLQCYCECCQQEKVGMLSFEDMIKSRLRQR